MLHAAVQVGRGLAEYLFPVPRCMGKYSAGMQCASVPSKSAMEMEVQFAPRAAEYWGGAIGCV